MDRLIMYLTNNASIQEVVPSNETRKKQVLEDDENGLFLYC
jgi:hypothetical protein